MSREIPRHCPARQLVEAKGSQPAQMMSCERVPTLPTSPWHEGRHRALIAMHATTATVISWDERQR